jgi:hypothetical protein
MLLCGAGLALRGSWSLAWANAILKGSSCAGVILPVEQVRAAHHLK